MLNFFIYFFIIHILKKNWYNYDNSSRIFFKTDFNIRGAYLNILYQNFLYAKLSAETLQEVQFFYKINTARGNKHRKSILNNLERNTRFNFFFLNLFFLYSEL